MAEYDPLKTLQQVTTVTQDKTQQTNNNKSEGLESEHIEVEFEESSKLGRKAQQSWISRGFFWGLAIIILRIKLLLLELRSEHSGEGEFHVSIWLDNGVPRYLSKHLILCVSMRMFPGEIHTWIADWWKQIAIPSLTWHHLIYWRSEYKKKMKKGEFLPWLTWVFCR